MNGNTIKTALTSLALVAALAAPAARAASVTIDFAWTGYYGGPNTADLKVYLTPVVGSPGVYDAVSISGTYAGLPITGLNTDFLTADQLIFAPSTGLPLVDDVGLGFGFGGHNASFRYSDDGLYVTQDNLFTPYPSGVSPTIEFNPTPEPSSWALMLIGVGGVGGVLRLARSRRTALATV